MDGQILYVVEWDLPIGSLEELEEYYSIHFENSDNRTEKAIVNTISGTDDVWVNNDQLSLTYCVSNAFGADQTRAINEMADATQDWENVSNVNFIYDPGENSNCNNTNPNIDFPVNPWTSGGARAFFPSTGGTLFINFNDIDNNFGTIAPNLTTTGVFRHELGHILGLRHEHTRSQAGTTCFEDNNWRTLTPYDINSVMHYQWCNGALNSDLSITDLDGEGMRSLYGSPPTWSLPAIIFIVMT